MRARSGPDRVPLRSPADCARAAKYSVSLEQFTLLRTAILEAIDAAPDGELPLRGAVEHAVGELSAHPAFPTGRVRYFATAVKGELQCRGEVRVLDEPGPQVLARGHAPVRLIAP